MPLTDLPAPIKNHILNKTNYSDYTTQQNSYSVTELLYCLKKAYYKRTQPKPQDIESAFNLYRGKVFDDLWSPLFKRNQIRCTHRVPNYPINISGKYDFLTDDGTVTDLKTSKNLYFVNEASAEYQKQVRFYAYCNALTKAQIVYIDFGDCKVFPVEVGDCTELINELEGKAIQLWSALQCGKPPTNLYAPPDWLCKKCDYKEECKNGN